MAVSGLRLNPLSDVDPPGSDNGGLSNVIPVYQRGQNFRLYLSVLTEVPY